MVPRTRKTPDKSLDWLGPSSPVTSISELSAAIAEHSRQGTHPMRNTHLSWRAQRGTRVRYAHDRASGNAVVLRVIPLTEGEDEHSPRRYLIEDLITKAQFIVPGDSIRPA